MISIGMEKWLYNELLVYLIIGLRIIKVFDQLFINSLFYHFLIKMTLKKVTSMIIIQWYPGC